MKRLFSISFISLILCGFISSGFCLHYPIVYMVHPTWPSCLQTIQEGVDACDPWDVVIVYPGTYNETVEINTPHIRIYAAIAGQRPVIDAGGATVAIEVLIDDVTIKGMHIINANNGIILSMWAIDCVIDDCVIFYDGSSPQFGITVDFENHNDTIKNCDIDGYDIGIMLRDATYNVLVANCNITNSVTNGISNSGRPSFSEGNSNHFTGCVINGAQDGILNENLYPGLATFTIQSSTIENASRYGINCSVHEYMGENSGAEANLVDILFKDCATAGIYGMGICDWTAGECYVYVSYSNCVFQDCGVNIMEADLAGFDNVTIVESDRAPDWMVGETYAIGDRVNYEGDIYVCIQAHTVYAPNWTPPNTPALWELE